MPSLKPVNVSWATDPGADIVDPPAGKKLSGWIGLDIPPHGWVNWMWNALTEWVNYLAGFTTRGVDSYVISDLDVVPVAVPNNNQVQVNPGFAVANGEHVEWVSVGTLNIPSNAGTALPGAPEFFLIVINENGSISPINLGTYANRAAALRDILPDVGNKDEASVDAPGASSPPRAMLALVVNEDGAPLYDAGQIIDVRQLHPISGRIVEPQSLRQNHLIDPGIYFDLDFTTEDETQAYEHRIDLEIKDFGGFGIDKAKLPAEVELQIKVYPFVALTAANEFGTAPGGNQYRDLSPWSTAPTGNDDALGVQINQQLTPGSGLAVLFMPNGELGGLNYGTFFVKPWADRIRLTLARYNGSALPERKFFVEISCSHGGTITREITFRAT